MAAAGELNLADRTRYGDAKDLVYFHPEITSMEQVRKIMYPYIRENGNYLLRISTSAEKTFTVSVVHNSGIKHFKILKRANQYYLQDRLFDSIDGLMQYYRINDVPNMEQVGGVRLIHPIENRNKMRRLSTQRGSVSSAGSTFEDEDPHIAYNKLFPGTRTSGRQLPSPPSRVLPKRSTGSLKEESRRVIDHSRTRTRSNNLEERPPAPLPESPNDPADDGATGSKTGIYNGVYYSCVQRKEENKLPLLMEALSMQPAETTHCECGLDIELSQLPEGWSVHISREAEASYGKPFFMSPKQTTHWELPKEIYLDLNRHQQKFIKFLLDNYKKGNPPPDESTQFQWSSSSSSGDYPEVGRRVSEAASAAQRDSTGSNSGASGSGAGFYTGRGIGHIDDGAAQPVSEASTPVSASSGQASAC